MSVSVRLPGARVDTWRAIPGETRWVDYSCDRAGDDLVVYVHTFRRVRERLDRTQDLLLWKPGTARVARRYAAGEWDEVVGADREWPPAELTQVPRRRPA
ncbi:hypothetical protein [Nocardioides sp.]|uniref:hypothetical protein n=1 Tax=Nocardioides sp. TaxID=35761 RepID=UPI002EDA8376